MATREPDLLPTGNPTALHAALQHHLWRNQVDLSSALDAIEAFLERAGADRGPWLVAGFGAGIACWFALGNIWQWLALVAACLGVALVAATIHREGRYGIVRLALISLPLALSAGCALAWVRADWGGTPPIAKIISGRFAAEVLERDEDPADHKLRLIVATREPASGRAIRVRLNIDPVNDRPGLVEGARIGFSARLYPPMPPMLPGSYDFARAAWFSGLSATGRVQGPIAITRPSLGDHPLARTQHALAAHVRSRIAGSAGGIAAAFASGDRGGITRADEDAMRDAGLTHLLSISGLHVSAVIAGGYFLALRLFALFPWLALRVRLPLLAAAVGAFAGIGYTVLTGAQVPTIRSCLGAILVMLAIVVGRQPISMRLLAVVALVLMVFYPEEVVGPSFQMSFGSVIAIIALHNAAPVRAFAGKPGVPWYLHAGRELLLILLTGVVIDLALMPMALYHFHRAGVYGAFANVIAIPLTTLVSMPFIALALLFDTIGVGGPFWWVAGKSLELLLGIAHLTAGLPGAVTRFPAMGEGAFAVFVFGGLWLALWRGRIRLLGLVPAAIGTVLLAALPAPDLLVSGDGRSIGIIEHGHLLLMHPDRSRFAQTRMLESAGMQGESRQMAEWPGAVCDYAFCAIELRRGARNWQILIARGRKFEEGPALDAACARVDLVVAPMRLPFSCRPRWMRIDRSMLVGSGGVAVSLAAGQVRTVVDEEGSHRWWGTAARMASAEASAEAEGPTDPRPQPPAGRVTHAAPAAPSPHQ